MANTVVCDGCGRSESVQTWWPRRAKRLGWICLPVRVGVVPTVWHDACSLVCAVRIVERAERGARVRGAGVASGPGAPV